MYGKLVIYKIDPTFCIAELWDVSVTVLRHDSYGNTDYFNVTKLCRAFGKKFTDWKQTNSANKLIRDNAAKDIIKIKSSKHTARERSVSGYYTSKGITLHVAYWIAPSVAIKIALLIQKYISSRDAYRVTSSYRLVLKRGYFRDLLVRLNKKYTDEIIRVRYEYKRREICIRAKLYAIQSESIRIKTICRTGVTLNDEIKKELISYINNLKIKLTGIRKAFDYNTTKSIMQVIGLKEKYLATLSVLKDYLFYTKYDVAYW